MNITDPAAYAPNKLAALIKVIRILGITAIFELEPLYGALGRRVCEAFSNCFEAHVLIRINGNIIALYPSLIIENFQV